MLVWFMFFMIFLIVSFKIFSLVNLYTWCLCTTPLPGHDGDDFLFFSFFLSFPFVIL